MAKDSRREMRKLLRPGDTKGRIIRWQEAFCVGLRRGDKEILPESKQRLVAIFWERIPWRTGLLSEGAEVESKPLKPAHIQNHCLTWLTPGCEPRMMSNVGAELLKPCCLRPTISRKKAVIGLLCGGREV